MHPRAEGFREIVRDEYDLSVDVRELPEGTKTAADAADALDCSLDAIVKSVVMAVDGEPVLVLTSGSNRVDEEALAVRFDASEVRSASPDEVSDWTGYSIGGVPPIDHDIDRVLLDPALLDHREIWGGAGTPSAVAAFDPEAVRRVTGASTANVFG